MDQGCPQGPLNTECAHCPANQHRDDIVEQTIKTLLSTLDLQSVVDRTSHLLRTYFGCTRVELNRICRDDPGQYEVLLVDDPHHPAEGQGERHPLEGSACGLVVKTRELQILDRLSAEHPRVREETLLAQLGYGSVACFPLQVDDQVLGTLHVAHLPACGLLGHCLKSAEQVARLLGIALHNSQLMEEVRRLNKLLDRENTYLKDQIRQSRQGMDYVAESGVMREVLKQVRMVAVSDSAVLIRGETGTGKEGLARLVHEMSGRKDGPFVVINLGAIPETLIESELFGHERGAFTGADRRKMGRFEQAAGGTLFLDEVGDAPLPVQIKLLRALQEGQIERLGGTQSIKVDVRVVTATNRPLEQLMEQGTFRSDFYYRLSTFPIYLPPLRDRREDLRPLVLHLLERRAGRMHRRAPRVPDPVWRVLEDRSWPGNVRELENFLERALILSPGPVLTLPEMPVADQAIVAAPAPFVGGGGSFDQSVRQILEQALKRSEGKLYGPAGAAALLGLKPTTLQGKLKKYGLR